MADQLIDIYDSDMNLLGTAMKSQAYGEGLWHKNVHVWALDGDDVWFQLRSQNKPYYPSLLDATITGSIETGETPKQTAIREFEEKLGLLVSEAEFEKLFTYKFVEDATGFLIRAFCPIYVIRKKLDAKAVVFNPDEVEALFKAKLDDLIDLFAGDVKNITLVGYSKDSKALQKRKVSASDFAPYGENYYLKVLTTLDRMIG